MKIYTVKPDFFTHNSDIIKTGRFKELLDPSAYEYYVKHTIALKIYLWFILSKNNCILS